MTAATGTTCEPPARPLHRLIDVRKSILACFWLKPNALESITCRFIDALRSHRQVELPLNPSLQRAEGPPGRGRESSRPPKRTAAEEGMKLYSENRAGDEQTSLTRAE